jgi:hypothetical protein
MALASAHWPFASCLARTRHTLACAVPTAAHLCPAVPAGSRVLAPRTQLMRLPSELVHQPPKPTPPLYDLTREQAPSEDVQRLVFKQV